MSRLFIGARELALVSDLTKEIVHDVIGETIVLYQIDATLTNVHAVYDESPDKVFSNPIEIGCLIDWGDEEVVTTKSGHENLRSVKVFIQLRDLLHRKIKIEAGDFFSYGARFFEIVAKRETRLLFGQAEAVAGIELMGKQARQGQFSDINIGRLPETYDAERRAFVQQRGFSENIQGETNDKRELIDNGTISVPLSQPREVSDKGDAELHSFYGED